MGNNCVKMVDLKNLFPDQGDLVGGPELLDWADWTDNQYVIRRYKVLDHLGSGSFAEVASAVQRRTGLKVALKIVHLARPGLTAQVLEIMRKEADILRDVQGVPGLVKLYEVVEDKRHIFIVHELCSGGELYDALAKLREFDEGRAARLFRAICTSVSGMHARGYLHRDLKPENVLFVESSQPRGEEEGWAEIQGRWVSPRIIDLGMSDRYVPDRPVRGVCGSPGFIAPEILRGEVHTPKMDVYSLGVMLFMMLTGLVPYGEDVSRDLKYGNLPLAEAKHWADGSTARLSSHVRDLLERMLDPKAETRISLGEVLEHSWFQPGGQGSFTLKLADVLRRHTTTRKKQGHDACLAEVTQDTVAKSLRAFKSARSQVPERADTPEGRHQGSLHAAQAHGKTEVERLRSFRDVRQASFKV